MYEPVPELGKRAALTKRVIDHAELILAIGPASLNQLWISRIRITTSQWKQQKYDCEEKKTKQQQTTATNTSNSTIKQQPQQDEIPTHIPFYLII